MMSFISNAALEEKEAAESSNVVEINPDLLMSALASHVRKQWEINKDHKLDIEKMMLEDLKQRNGEYDEDVKAAIQEMGGSKIFMRLTATKCRAALSWITDILFPAGDKAWSIEPTPIPELNGNIEQSIQQQVASGVQQVQQQGAQVSEEDIKELEKGMRERVKQAMIKQAADASRAMEDKIEDQLVDSKWETAMMEFLDDFVTFPAAIVKGPVYRMKKRLKWGDQGEPIVDYYACAMDERVSPFDIFPSPGAIDIEDGNLIERVHFSRSDLYGLIGHKGYNEDAIRKVLDEPQSNSLWDTAKEDEIRRAETGIQNNNNDDDLIDGLHYWGTASGKVLQDWGLPQVEDPQKEYEIEAILIGREVIRVAINDDPLGRRPYYKACFQNKPGSFWGESIPRLMRDVQRMCNATARALSNNMGMASGPQVVVMKDLMAKGETISQMYPWKQWQMTTNPMGQNSPPISFFQPNSNAQELLNVYEYFEQKADDATNVPRYSYGNEKVAGAGQTAQGLAMLLESATKGIKQAIRHIDTRVIKPRIERQYHENMLYEDDPTIKGDLQVVARGSSALIAKAATQARRNEFLQMTANEMDMQIIGAEGRTELLRQMVRDLDMDGVVPDEEVVKAKQEQMAQQPPPEDPRVALERMRMEGQMALEQFRAQQADMDRQMKIQVAMMEREGDMMELAGKREIDLEKIKAKLGEVAIKERGARQRIADEAEIKKRFGSGI